MLSVVHHHGFKCAGSTVVHVLNRNWPGRVLHVEHRVDVRRIQCGQVRSHAGQNGTVAVTSHLLTMPSPGEALAHVHFALVRDPIARFVSTYKFVPEADRCGGLLGYAAANRIHAGNFHVRHLAVVTPGGGVPQAECDGWSLRPDAVPLGAPHVLIGLVERFADSMFLLEHRLRAVGHAFDGSVGAAQNVGQGDEPELDGAALAWLREQNALDYELYARVAAQLDAELAAVDPDGSGRAEHLRRCAARCGQAEAYLGLAPELWTYLDD